VLCLYHRRAERAAPTRSRRWACRSPT